MTRYGLAADPEARSCLKSWDNGTKTVGFVLTAYATRPAPDCISAEGIKLALDFAVARLQSAADYLQREQEDIASAKQLLSRQLRKINAGIQYFARQLGQGICLGGAVCAIMGQDCIVTVFGGGCGCIWKDDELTYLQTPNAKPRQIGSIADALGCRDDWEGSFLEQALPAGSHLLCFTQAPDEPPLIRALQSMMQANAEGIAQLILEGERQLPTAVLDIIQIPEDMP